MALTNTQKVTLWASVIIAFGGIIAAVIGGYVGAPSSNIQQKGQGNIIIEKAHDFQIDQSQKILSPEAELEGFIMPANEPTPPHPCQHIEQGKMILLMGGSAFVVKKRDYNPILTSKGKTYLWLERNSSGAYISFEIFRQDGRLVAKMERNKWTINRNNYYKLIRPDRHEIQIKDNSDQKVLQVRYVNESTFTLEGIFYFPGKGKLIITRKEFIGTKQNFRHNCLHDNGNGAIIIK